MGVVRLPYLFRGFRSPALAAIGVLTILPYIHAVSAQELPKVASINVCTDQLVLNLADPSQILSVSWLAADPEESMFAEQASHYPLNYGTAEEILRLKPDIVIGGRFTSQYTRQLLAELGYPVIDIAPALTLLDVEQNLRKVAVAIGRESQAEKLIARMRVSVHTLETTRPAATPEAVVLRAGGFTVGAETLAHQLMWLAGLRNLAAEKGLDRWGSLSMETLLLSRPDLIVFMGYRSNDMSLANAIFQHPALAKLSGTVDTVTVPSKYWSCGLPESLVSAELLRSAVESWQ